MDIQGYEMKCKKEIVCLNYRFQKSKVIIAGMANDTKLLLSKKKKSGYDTIYSFVISENRKKNTYCSCLYFGEDLVQPQGTAAAGPEITATSKGGEKLKGSKAVKRTAAKPQTQQRKALTLFWSRRLHTACPPRRCRRRCRRWTAPGAGTPPRSLWAAKGTLGSTEHTCSTSWLH